MLLKFNLLMHFIRVGLKSRIIERKPFKTSRCVTLLGKTTKIQRANM